MNLNNLFIEAVLLGMLPTVKQLVEAGANVRVDDDHALRWAASHGHLEIVKYLVRVGANVRADNDYALQLAAEYGNLEIVKYLVSVGADARAHGVIFINAAGNGHLEIVKYLVSVGADVRTRGDRALQLAAEFGQTAVVEFLKSEIAKLENRAKVL